jgi:hypothetical protein
MRSLKFLCIICSTPDFLSSHEEIIQEDNNWLFFTLFPHGYCSYRYNININIFQCTYCSYRLMCLRNCDPNKRLYSRCIVAESFSKNYGVSRLYIDLWRLYNFSGRLYMSRSLGRLTFESRLKNHVPNWSTCHVNHFVAEFYYFNPSMQYDLWVELSRQSLNICDSIAFLI